MLHYRRHHEFAARQRLAHRPARLPRGESSVVDTGRFVGLQFVSGYKPCVFFPTKVFRFARPHISRNEDWESGESPVLPRNCKRGPSTASKCSGPGICHCGFFHGKACRNALRWSVIR
jgi:hypothetical protein